MMKDRTIAIAAIGVIVALASIIGLALWSLSNALGNEANLRHINLAIPAYFHAHYTLQGAARNSEQCRYVVAFDSEDVCESEFASVRATNDRRNCGISAVVNSMDESTFEISVFSDFASDTLLPLENGKLAPDVMETVRAQSAVLGGHPVIITNQELTACEGFNVIRVNGVLP